MKNFNTYWVSTDPLEKWKEISLSDSCKVTSQKQATLQLSGVKYQKIKGFGACFNDLGWIALSYLDKEVRDSVIKDLFDSRDGCRFNFCRLPIGASDYSAEWYSHSEKDNDYAMEHFSIQKDYAYLLPFIKSAMEINPDLELFASPWSPPTWMKFPKAHNHGTLRWEKEILDAYALYFVKFIQAYKEEGINIEQVHVQNEPCADQKFPSCLWTGEQMRDFIKIHLGPAFDKHGIDTEIWLGTINNVSYNSYANIVLSDPESKKYVKGVGYQYAGKQAIQQTHDAWPEVRLMQTENECGNGKGENTWEYALYVFNLFRHYFVNGVESYIYWNMVLLPYGMSTWGWKQNALITVDNETKEVIYNPEYYLMKHFSHFISPGAIRLGLEGQWSGNALAFENPNGEMVLVICNPFTENNEVVFRLGEEDRIITLKAQSFNTIVLKK